eukprot:CAMPEP_0118931430 /NCGR_PEP_ID=MMETSP1169-20130426/7774_1 /TAXON_ID=36882 /ORGANISM="Pyramimonas obovata, Strain CCMP722" /LENGTH=231 /DNA_ID=CAMNT_0006873929 /DNA_START=102 /DNA_END=794 /DNA_ORIENTATION=-
MMRPTVGSASQALARSRVEASSGRKPEFVRQQSRASHSCVASSRGNQSGHHAHLGRPSSKTNSGRLEAHSPTQRLKQAPSTPAQTARSHHAYPYPWSHLPASPIRASGNSNGATYDTQGDFVEGEGFATLETWSGDPKELLDTQEHQSDAAKLWSGKDLQGDTPNAAGERSGMPDESSGIKSSSNKSTDASPPNGDGVLDDNGRAATTTPEVTSTTSEAAGTDRAATTTPE